MVVAIMSTKAMQLGHQLVQALSGGRARPGPPPPRERLERLAREVQEGSYRVGSEEIALAIMGRSGPPG
jgi:hypothetical protein